MHAAYLRMSAEEFGDTLCIFILPRHPHRQGLQSTLQNPGRVRIHAVAQRRPRLPDLIDQLLPSRHHAANQIRMSRQDISFPSASPDRFQIPPAAG